MTVQIYDKFALDLYFDACDHTEGKSIYYPAPPPQERSLNILELPLSINIRKSSLFCRAALAMTRYLPPTDDFKQINQERERM